MRSMLLLTVPMRLAAMRLLSAWGLMAMVAVPAAAQQPAAGQRPAVIPSAPPQRVAAVPGQPMPQQAGQQQPARPAAPQAGPQQPAPLSPSSRRRSIGCLPPGRHGMRL